MAHIRIISPSGAIDPMYIEGATRRLLSWGHIVSEGRYARCHWGRFAGTDEQRLADLTEALTDPAVDYVLCSRGGYGLQRIVDKLSVEGDIPVVIGFSDITALHQWCGLRGKPSLHAIMCKHIATLPEDSLPMRQLRAILDGQPLPYDLPIAGPVVGGNLSVLYGLQGTPYDLQHVYSRIRENGQKPILLLEDIGERHYHVERMLLGLKMSGALDGLAAVLVGQFSDCADDPAMGETLRETIARVLADTVCPAVYDVPVGHVEMNVPIWLNKI